ncbi:hypothetical protein [uncultured Ramlibacter sp.]|uniref:hypothetical protein n=1 Tax=uncultured Ramlibacter sp. TaxID=260755 RepID=UPI002633988D|nr:hypothetical protein [uncultured Ramlibacter sp.]
MAHSEATSGQPGPVYCPDESGRIQWSQPNSNTVENWTTFGGGTLYFDGLRISRHDKIDRSIDSRYTELIVMGAAAALMAEAGVGRRLHKAVTDDFGSLVVVQ